MKYTVGVAVLGFAIAEIEAANDKEAIRKAKELNHDDFEIDYATLGFDSSDKYRQIWDEDFNEVEDVE